MQVRGMGGLGIQYNGALDALRVIVRTEGFKGLYRGLWPNLRECSSFSVPFFFYSSLRSFFFALRCSVGLTNVFCIAVKVAPSIATSFFTYELVKDFLGAT